VEEKHFDSNKVENGKVKKKKPLQIYTLCLDSQSVKTGYFVLVFNLKYLYMHILIVLYNCSLNLYPVDVLVNYVSVAYCVCK